MVTPTLLSKLLCSNIANATPVYFDHECAVNRQEWLKRIGQWQQYFIDHPAKKRWALYHPNAGEFSCILFALWSCNKEAVLPGNLQTQALLKLSLEVDGFAGKFDNLPANIDVASALDISASASCSNVNLALDKPLLWIYTSGSSGEPKAIAKKLSQLESELNNLNEQWFNSPQTMAVISTVSHQHIYGLLFRVLLPLVNQWPFDAYPCEFIEQFEERRLNNLPMVVISSPTHLSRTPDKKARRDNYKVHTVFSSGAPLKREHSLLAQTLLEAPVYEVYGSSETGGIAWRNQVSDRNQAWQALPNVALRLSTKRQLEVRSEHIECPLNWYETSDKARFLTEDTFELLGRADNIVKVEGKRVSIQEVEKLLLAHELIYDARVIPLETHRTEIAAVAVLSQTGKQHLAVVGKRQFNKQLQHYLMQFIERPVTPRRWRYIDQLPFNLQGKLTHDSLKQLFMVTQSLEKFAIEHTCNGDDNERRLSFTVPENLLYFDGHFDHTSILPGVVQVQWAEHYAKREFGENLVFQNMAAIKFQQVVIPNQDLTLDLSYQPSKNYVKFAFHSSKGNHSSGKMMLKGQ